MTSDTVTSRNIRNPDQPLTVLTCYDYLTAKVMDEIPELDMILVGDSLGMVEMGYDNTLPVTEDDMVHHTASVSRGIDRAFLCTDLPFLATAESKQESVRSARRMMQEGGAQAVKIEGGQRNYSIIEHLTDFDVPVIGHLGLTPQSVEAFGGYQVQAQDRDAISELTKNALNLQEAGIIALVLECVPSVVASALTERLEIPTIGIGAGPGCFGQVLVWQDMMGLTEDAPGFVKEYDDFSGRFSESIKSYCGDVREGKFPGEQHSFELSGDLTVGEVQELVHSL